MAPTMPPAQRRQRKQHNSDNSQARSTSQQAPPSQPHLNPREPIPLPVLALPHNNINNNLLTTRQTPVDTIPAHYGSLYSGPSPGAVAGIVLGSVAGFILLLYLVYLCVNLGSNAPSWDAGASTTLDGESSVMTRRRRRSHHRHSAAATATTTTTTTTRRHSRHRHSSTTHKRGSRRAGVTETVEIRRTGSAGPPRVPAAAVVVEGRGGPTVERIVVEEERVRGRRRGGGPSRSRTRSRSRTSTSGGEDEVVVIEEHSPPRRFSGSRTHSVRSGSRRRGSAERVSGYGYVARSVSRRG